MKRAKRKRKIKRSRPRDEGAYTCPTCGESIHIPLDRSAGDEQQYVEDCPVCCNPNVIHVEFFENDEPARVWADAE
jgi:transcription elongation factor Elf1